MVIGKIIQLSHIRVDVNDPEDDNKTVEVDRILALDDKGNIWIAECFDSGFTDIVWNPVKTPCESNIDKVFQSIDSVDIRNSIEDKSSLQ